MSNIRYETDGPVATLCLDRPEKLNAITEDMLRAMTAALDEAAADDAVRVLVLRGEGRAFSAGFDLEWDEPEDPEERAEAIRRELEFNFESIMRFWDFPKPVIVAVQGYCLGGSMEIASVCDITIAADDCRFGAPEVTFGSGMMCLILPWIVGQKNARELLLVGRKDVSAERAISMGLVNKVVPGDELLDTVHAMATEIAQNDPLAVQLTKKAINHSIETAGLRQALEDALEIDIEIETRGADRA